MIMGMITALTFLLRRGIGLKFVCCVAEAFITDLLLIKRAAFKYQFVNAKHIGFAHPEELRGPVIENEFHQDSIKFGSFRNDF
jgi:hypothetical protein